MILGSFLPLQSFGRVKRISTSSLYVYLSSSVKASGPGLLFTRWFVCLFVCLITESVSLLVVSLFKFFISSRFSFGGLYVARIMYVFCMLLESVVISPVLFLLFSSW